MFGRNQNDKDPFFSDNKKGNDRKIENNETIKKSEPQIRPKQPLPTRSPGVRPEGLPPRSEESPGMVRPTASHSDSKILTISEDITLSGEIKRCDKLIIEGEADVSLEGTRVIEVATSGIFRGDTEVEDADIAGTYTGTLTATNRLIIRKTGQVTGNIRYKELVVEAGGQLGGDVNFVEKN